MVLIAAVINAVYTLPMKFNKQWKWEHSWLVFTIAGRHRVPTILSVLTIPRLKDAYDGVGAPILIGMALCGALWGVSLVFFGRAVDTVGVAITFAVSLGTSAASGALIPLLSQHSTELFTRRGVLIVSGILVIIVRCRHLRDGGPPTGKGTIDTGSPRQLSVDPGRNLSRSCPEYWGRC